jgi:hypothetical protein
MKTWMTELADRAGGTTQEADEADEADGSDESDEAASKEDGSEKQAVAKIVDQQADSDYEEDETMRD